MSTPVVTLQLTFDDEFDSFSNSPDGSVGWQTKLPYYGSAARNLSSTSEIEYYSDSSVGVNPFSVNNGVLSITATIQDKSTNHGFPYASGTITSYDSFHQEYGYFELNAKLPAGNGLWSAFWLAPSSLDGQSELDALEVLGNDPSQYYATTHAVVNGVFTPNLQLLDVADTSAAFHTYGVDWEPTTITWYDDGVAIATAPTPPNMDEKMFMLLNLPVGGVASWPGPPTSSSEFPASMQVDYVHAYATANTRFVGGTAAIGLGAPQGEASVTGVVAVGLGAGTPLAGVTVTLLDAGGASLGTTTTDANGDYQFIDLDPGAYLVRMTPPSGYTVQAGSTGAAAVALSAGQAGSAAVLKLATTTTVTGMATFASDGAGTPLSGVSVVLLNASGAKAGSATTNANGVFSITDLAVGTYQVRYAPPAGAVLESGPGDTRTGLTGAFTVSLDQTTALPVETLGPPGTITGSTEFGVAAQAGVRVVLLSGDGATTLAATSTDANGTYRFTGLSAGDYRVKYLPPAGEIIQSGPVSAGETAAFSVPVGGTRTVGPVIFAPAPASISGSVSFAGVGQAGVGVALLDAAGVTTLATATTDASGAFAFAGLAAGSYQVQYTAPSGELLQSGPGSATTGLTGPLTVAAGQNLALAAESLAPPFATITGSVLFAGAGQGAVAVALLDGGGSTVATTSTDVNGAFSFTGLTAGTYALDYSVPLGEAFQAGDPADLTTGVTGTFTIGAGQSYAAAPEHLLLAPASLALSNSRATINPGSGTFIVTGSPGFDTVILGDGNQTVSLGGYANHVTLGNGNETVTFTGQQDTLHAGSGSDIIVLGSNFDTAVFGDTPAGATSTVVLNGLYDTVMAGAGSVIVSGAGGSAAVMLGDGNDVVSITGSRNIVTVGSGTNVINAGTNGAVVRTGSGGATVTVGGQTNRVDVGAGTNTINAGGNSRLDTFVLNGSGQGLTTINGFNTNTGDVLDLTRTLLGVNVAADLSNLGQYITASVSNGATTLYVDPTGGAGTPYAFASLQNVTTSVSALAVAHDIKVS